MEGTDRNDPAGTVEDAAFHSGATLLRPQSVKEGCRATRPTSALFVRPIRTRRDWESVPGAASERWPGAAPG